MIGRRLFAAGALTGLAGCGFHPLYGKFGPGGGVVAPAFAAIYVAVMPERQGQLLRQALQARLGGTGESVTRLYELTGGLAIGAEGIGIQQDTSSTRTRFTASSNWRLTKLDVASTLVTSGVARAVDGININDQEYFAADLETSAAYRRLADEVATQITLDLAVFFRTHPELA